MFYMEHIDHVGSGGHSFVDCLSTVLTTHMVRVGTEIVHFSRGKLSLGEENLISGRFP